MPHGLAHRIDAHPQRRRREPQPLEELADPYVEGGTVARRADETQQRGTLHDLYTGETVTFVRISEGYQPTQVDHLIPLSVAWATGAAEWPADKRLQLANDPSNLQVTTANQLKNDSTPSQWMPIASYTCENSTRYVQVAHAYELEISSADRTKLAAALSQCASTSP